MGKNKSVNTSCNSAQAFINDITTFNAFSKTTVFETIDNIPYYTNEFWTSKQRQAHSLQEISYRACFKPQLPEFFISRLTQIGDNVLDPFMGRGTTPIQAALMHRNSYGNDINPLSTMLTKPRLYPISLQDIQDALHTVDWSKGKIERDDLLAFYHKDTLKHIEALRAWIKLQLESTPNDNIVEWIRMVALNRLSGHSSGFFSGMTMPPNQAVSVKAQQKINEKLGLTPPVRDIASIIMKKSKSLLRDGCITHAVNHKLLTSLATEISEINDGSIHLTVTSPPFLDIVQYADDNWLRCWFAGINPDTISISMHNTEELWSDMVYNVLKEQARVVKSGGYVAFEVGEVRNGKVLLEKLVWNAAATLPFDRLGIMINSQQFTKTANCWGVDNKTKGTNTNRIVLLQRK